MEKGWRWWQKGAHDSVEWSLQKDSNLSHITGLLNIIASCTSRMKTLILLRPLRKTGFISSLSLPPSVSLGVPPEPLERTWLICDITFSPPSLPLLFHSLLPSFSPSSVTSCSVSCGIREMIKEDSFKYLSSLSQMATQSRWARRRWELARRKCQAGS